MKRYMAFAILLIVVIAIAIPVSYFVANSVVSDAVYYKFNFGDSSGSGIINAGSTNVTFTGNFNFANGADIPLTLDRVNITVYVIPTDHPYDGSIFFDMLMGTGEPHVGNVLIENELLPAHGQFNLPVNWHVTSQDALDRISTGNYSVGWGWNELTVSGTYLFWHITPPMLFM